MKIYLVDNGEQYSDWDISAVFDDLDLALEYADGWRSVREMDTNDVKKLSEGEIEYKVKLDYLNNEVEWVRRTDAEFSKREFSFNTGYTLFATVVATSEYEAVGRVFSEIGDEAAKCMKYLEESDYDWLGYKQLKEAFG